MPQMSRIDTLFGSQYEPIIAIIRLMTQLVPLKEPAGDVVCRKMLHNK